MENVILKSKRNFQTIVFDKVLTVEKGDVIKFSHHNSGEILMFKNEECLGDLGETHTKRYVEEFLEEMSVLTNNL